MQTLQNYEWYWIYVNNDWYPAQWIDGEWYHGTFDFYDEVTQWRHIEKPQVQLEQKAS